MIDKLLKEFDYQFKYAKNTGEFRVFLVKALDEQERSYNIKFQKQELDIALQEKRLRLSEEEVERVIQEKYIDHGIVSAKKPNVDEVFVSIVETTKKYGIELSYNDRMLVALGVVKMQGDKE